MEFITAQNLFIALPVLFIGLYIYVVIMKNTEAWLWVTFFLHLALYLQRSDEITIPEIVFGLFFYPGILVWFVKMLVLKKKIIKGWEDLAFLCFLTYAFFSTFLATYLDFSFEEGIRQYINFFVPYLFYFPIREYITTTKRGYNILWAFIIVSTIVAVYNILNYRLSVAVAQYFWEVWGHRKREPEPLYMTSIVFLFSFLTISKKKSWLIYILIFINMLGLLITFTRMFWAGLILSLFVLVILTHKADRKKLILILSTGAITGIIGIVILFPNMFNAILEGVLLRMSRTDAKDLSYLSRLSESISILKLFSANPVIGYGLGSTISFYDPIPERTTTYWYMHNAYLFLLNKFGIIGFCLFMSFYLKKLLSIFKSIFIIDKFENHRNLLISFFSVLAVFLIINITAPQFYEKRSLLSLTVMWGVADGWINLIKKSKNAAINT